ncbi:transporter [Deinococcus sp. SDU3-2]|uniref:Transporter n=1 Tax=Deinococcus terrestris TaxID=2651870 RepID=A0A7X1NX80_9DEIO|nr:TrkA C-terminal domain-containing protein [Deinococcus terrestris]MPY67500.1 transporter [Deinococcus terrestris]
MLPLLDLLAQNPVLTLFTVLLLGFALGGVRVFGFSLGVAGVLFAGLFVSALDPRIALDPAVYELGLALFVYAIALASGGHVLSSFGRAGLIRNGLVLGLLTLGAGLTLGLGRLLGLEPALTAGLYTGALTSTPALAGVIEAVAGQPGAGDPVVAYSIAYPMGVIGVMLALFFFERRFRPDYAAEARALGVSGEEPVTRTLRVTDGRELTVESFVRAHGGRVVFGRLLHGGHLETAEAGSVLRGGDLVSVTGAPADVAAVIRVLGEEVAQSLSEDRSVLDFRRIFVSSPGVAGRRLSELRVNERLGATVTRVRRGDRDIVPDGRTVLELGDRVRVLAPRGRMAEVTRFFGDSYRHLSEINLLTFSLGLVLGLLVGTLPLPLPGGGTFRLGVAGGPLLVGLVLGALGRSGRVVWNIPYSANLTLRQFGLALFLAGVGLRSGGRFAAQLATAEGLALLLAGAAVTLSVTGALLWTGYRLLRLPYSLLSGLAAGLDTQPAVLGYATERTRSEVPELGYASVYPAALIGKILLAQLILRLAG